DRDRVPVAGDTDGTGRARVPDDLRDIAVRLHLAVRDVAELVPHRALEVGTTADRQRDAELLELAGEVCLELLGRLGEQRVVADGPVGRAEVQPAEPGVVDSQGQVADGRLDHGPAHVTILAPATDRISRKYATNWRRRDDLARSLGVV